MDLSRKTNLFEQHERSSLKLQSKFSRNRDNILFTMELKNVKGDGEVAISLLYGESQEKYLLKIDSEAIKNNEDLNKYFVSAAQFYEEIVENFDSVMLENEGVMKVEMSLGKTRKIVIALKGVRQERNIIEEKFKLPESIIEELENLKKMNMNQSRELFQLKCEVKQLRATREEVEKQKLVISKLWEYVKSMQKPQKVQKLQEKEVKQEEPENKVTLIAHEDHYQNSRFKLNSQTLQIKKVSKDLVWPNFIFKENVKDGECKQIKVMLQKTSQSQFIVGVLEKSLFNGINAFNSRKQIAYKMNKNCLSTQEINKVVQSFYRPKEGQYVTFIIDRKIGIVSIYYSKELKGESFKIHSQPLHEQVKNYGELYFFVSICKPGESLILCQ